MPTATGTVSAITAKAPRRQRARHTSTRDQGEGERDRSNGAHPAPQRRRSRSEHAHADHRDGREQRRDRVAHAERVLRTRQHRAEPDELGAKRQRGQRNSDEQTEAAAQSAVATHLSSYRGLRFSTNAETPSAKSCVPRSSP